MNGGSRRPAIVHPALSKKIKANSEVITTYEDHKKGQKKSLLKGLSCNDIQAFREFQPQQSILVIDYHSRQLLLAIP